MAGFVADPGTDFTRGQTPVIRQRLDQLAKRLGITIYGISGYRTPSHSVAVGGSANDPHTQGQAADIGVNANTRGSAAQLTDAQLASVGLYRPFAGAQEINHVQLKPDRGILGDIGHVASEVGKHLSPIPGTSGLVAPGVAGEAGRAIGSAETQAAEEGFKLGFGDLWDSASSHAAYAGLFLLVLAAGAYLAVKGLGKTAGARQEQPA
jgi:hypothetical protein